MTQQGTRKSRTVPAMFWLKEGIVPCDATLLAHVNDHFETPPDHPIGEMLFEPSRRPSRRCTVTVGGLVPLTWDNLVHLGTRQQRHTFNRVRYHYVGAVMRQLQVACSNRGVCSMRSAGTDIKYAGPASDIDINIVFTDISQNTVKVIDRVYDMLHKIHKQWFVTPLAELFDTNFYAGMHGERGWTRMHVPQKTVLRQHVWAFLRVQEVLDDAGVRWTSGNAIFDAVVRSPASRLLRQVRSDRRTYQNAVKAVFRTQEPSDEHDVSLHEHLVERFSVAKAKERGTYRSVGAYLHIVENRRDLDPHLYLDSVLDNFGFLVENMFQQGVCYEVDSMYTLMRVCKYMERMCDAVLLFIESSGESSSAFMTKLKKLCHDVNSARKSGSNATREVLKVSQVLVAPGTRVRSTRDLVQTTYKPSATHSLHDGDKLMWLEAITELFIKPLPFASMQ
jgi:hypothetical protein